MHSWRNDRTMESNFRLPKARNHGKINIWEETNGVSVFVHASADIPELVRMVSGKKRIYILSLGERRGGSRELFLH